MNAEILWRDRNDPAGGGKNRAGEGSRGGCDRVDGQGRGQRRGGGGESAAAEQMAKLFQ